MSGQLLVKSSVGTWGAATIHEVSTGLRFLFARDLLENATSLFLSTARQALFYYHSPSTWFISEHLYSRRTFRNIHSVKSTLLAFLPVVAASFYLVAIR